MTKSVDEKNSDQMQLLTSGKIGTDNLSIEIRGALLVSATLHSGQNTGQRFQTYVGFLTVFSYYPKICSEVKQHTQIAESTLIQ